MPMLAANGESLHFEQAGSGPAVALIHGLGANCGLWQPQLEALAGRYRVVAMDCRGHGGSSANGGARVSNCADDLIAVLDHLAVDKCHLVGLDMGAAVALRFGAAYPARVRSLVLADFAVKPVEGSADHFAATREAIAYISMQEFGTQYAAQNMMFTTPLQLQDEVASSISRMNPKTYLEAMQSFLLEDFTPLVASIKAPTLILAGAHDPVLPPDAAQALAAGIAGAAYETIPEAAHLSNLDNPAAFNAALSKFFGTLS